MQAEEKEYVLVTEYYYPDTASTGQLMTEFATGLRERGLDISVYTSQPNYHSGDNERQPRVSIHDGVQVRRIRAPQVRQSSVVRRLFNWTVFNLWMAIALLVDKPKKEREIIFVSITPLLPEVLTPVCRLRGWDYTYIAYDLYPDKVVELGYVDESGPFGSLWRLVSNWALRNATRIVVNGELMRERMIDNTNGAVQQDDIHIIHNWADEKFVTPLDKSENWFSREHGLVEPFTILYSGNLGEFHDLETLINASARFIDDEVQFLIIGEGDNRKSLVRLADQLGVRGSVVKFLPYQPIEDLPYSLTAGDVSVVSVREGCEGVCVSSKLYSSMAAGTPILCIDHPYDDEAMLIDRFQMGIHVPPGDVDGVVDAIETWRADPALVDQQGQNAREAFERHYTKDICLDQYYELFVNTQAVARPVNVP